MGILDGLKAALTTAKDAQTLPVLRERLILAQEQVVIAEKKTAELEAENADLLRENRELRKQIDFSRKDDEYLDLGICCVKRNAQGGYFDTPLCPSCKKPFTRLGGYTICGSCSVNIDSKAVREAVKKVFAS